MENPAEMYFEEQTAANEIKGFTKSFTKRTKDKKEENKDVKDLLQFLKEGKLIIGAKVTEKAFKNGIANKVYTATNCDKLTLNKIKHYAKIANVEVIELDLDNLELGQKLVKPFLISMVCVRASK